MQQGHDVSELAFEQLFEMAEDKFNQMDYEQAQFYYSMAFKKRPHDDMIVLCYANTLKHNGKSDEAKQILLHSLKNNPNGSYKRYFEMAELEEGEKSIQIFEQGIAAARKCLSNPFMSVAPQAEVKRDIAQAYASIAEVCMTDLCNVPFEQVEAKCAQVLEKGKQIDPTCMDVHIQIVNCLIEKQQKEMAKKQLLNIKQAILEEKEDYEDELITHCARYFMELSQYQHAIDVLDKLNESQNNDPETIYLLAFCSFQLQQFDLCKDYIEDYPNEQMIDEEIDVAMKQLKIQLEKKVKKNGDETEEGNEQQQEWMDVEDQDDQLN